MEYAVATQQPLPWQEHHGRYVGDVMGSDQPSLVQIRPSVGELWHFQYFPTWRLPAMLNLKKNNIWSMVM